MSGFLSWYILITLLGWITFPLAYRLFPALSDRGYTLSRALGLLIWGYVFWLFASLGIAQNDMGGLLLGLVILAGLSAWAIVNRKSEIVNWLSENRRLILTTEILFLLAFAVMALIRSANPEIVGTEKPMELMMIHGILNSPTFPPRDLWLSGYSISYYYFGYVMTSMLAMITGVPATMAFNLMIALVFSLSAVGAYGILYNLLANHRKALGWDQFPVTDDPPVSNLSEASRRGQSPIANYNVSAEDQPTKQPLSSLRLSSHRPDVLSGVHAFFFPLLAPLFLLLVSNVEGFLEILHARGLFWKDGPNFWTWLDILELRDAPAQTLSWIPQRAGWWWWRASRVIMDYDLQGNWTLDVINEFPAFSYILGDLHPHVLAMPFVLLAVAVALNLFLGGWSGKIDLYFGQLHISKTGFLLIALMLGGLAFLNTWDILIAGALIVFSYALARAREAGEAGWGWERIEDILWLGIPVMVTAYVLYLPFFIGFDSQAGGVVPNFMFPTRGAQLWVMWGTLFTLLFAYVLYMWRSGVPANWRLGIFAALGLVILLLVAMFVIGFVGLNLRPELVNPILESQGRTAGQFIADSMTRRLTYIGSLITLLALLIPTLAFLFATRSPQTETSLLYEAGDDEGGATGVQPSTVFVLLLITLGTLLILGPEFLYLRDNFGFRINTIFKFYYQAWIVLSLAAAYGAAVLFGRFDYGSREALDPPLNAKRGAANVIFSILFVLVLVVGLVYPVLGVASKTNGFNPPFEYTLDDFDRVQRETPDEAAALLWLRSAPDGVIAEAIGGAYSSYARVSIYTGLPTVLGWGNHEGQWRDYALQGSRAQDIEMLYSTPDWAIAQDILQRYNIRYVYIGNLERVTYRVSEEKFKLFLKPVFQQGNVVIYEVP
jgi:YYY domain-containing protein